MPEQHRARWRNPASKSGQGEGGGHAIAAVEEGFQPVDDERAVNPRELQSLAGRHQIMNSPMQRESEDPCFQKDGVSKSPTFKR